ncbi:MAG TPA: AMP-binding protein [Candidatus Limnocylindrales bacterium]|nr:AMP-binding protein [Candidatus Limnocylindrales bacterium]
MINNDQRLMNDHKPTIFGKSVQSQQVEPLLPRLHRAAEGSNTITFVSSASGNAEKQAVTLTWTQLHQNAMAVAASLQARGVVPGDHIALLGPTTCSLVTAIRAVWLAGASVSMLPIPMRFSSVEEFAMQIRTLMQYSDISLLLLDSALAAFYEAKPGDPPVVLLSDLEPGQSCLTASDYRAVPDDPESLAVIQFTSGSTTDPKGVMLCQRVLGANLDGMIEAAQVATDDTFVSWLPLYHDMGLVGLLTVPMVAGCNLVLAAPQDFLAQPANWLRWIHEYSGTVTAGPNFSWVLASRALRRMADTGEILDLSKVRIALNGAEPVDPAVVETLIASAKPHGFREGAVFCAFGMAELSLGGTFPPLMRGMVTDAVDRNILEAEGRLRAAEPGDPATRRFPLLGMPIPGLEMRICDPASGVVKSIREVGELEIRGTSVTTGYYKRPDLDQDLFHDGWLRTGDLAYFLDGPDGGPPELIICGRIKDVIIIAGRNIFPEDIERAVGCLEGVRAGNVIAFGVEGSKRKEVIVVVAEVRTGDSETVHRLIRQQVIGVCGFPPRDIVLVQPGTLPKTSSGKLQRSLCRKQYLEKELQMLE